VEVAVLLRQPLYDLELFHLERWDLERTLTRARQLRDGRENESGRFDRIVHQLAQRLAALRLGSGERPAAGGLALPTVQVAESAE
jgi:hypothetical protein